MTASLVQLSQGILENASTKVLTLLFGFQLPHFSPLTFIHFLFNLRTLASDLLDYGLGFMGLGRLLAVFLDLAAQIEDELGCLSVNSSGAMHLEFKMLVVTGELFLANLTVVGTRDGHIQRLVTPSSLRRSGVLDTALNLFFELVFLEDGIFLVVFLF